MRYFNVAIAGPVGTCYEGIYIFLSLLKLILLFFCYSYIIIMHRGSTIIGLQDFLLFNVVLMTYGPAEPFTISLQEMILLLLLTCLH